MQAIFIMDYFAFFVNHFPIFLRHPLRQLIHRDTQIPNNNWRPVLGWVGRPMWDTCCSTPWWHTCSHVQCTRRWTVWTASPLPRARSAPGSLTHPLTGWQTSHPCTRTLGKPWAWWQGGRTKAPYFLASLYLRKSRFQHRDSIHLVCSWEKQG